MLFSLGGLFSIYEGYHKLMHPEPLSQIWIAIVVLSLAIVLEGFSLFGALREIGKVRAGRPFREWLKHTRNSELVVVLGEDIGAQLGLVLALCFLVIAATTGDPMYDALGSICIGVVLLVISVFVAWRVKSLLVGRSADPEIHDSVWARHDAGGQSKDEPRPQCQRSRSAYQRARASTQSAHSETEVVFRRTRRRRLTALVGRRLVQMHVLLRKRE